MADNFTITDFKGQVGTDNMYFDTATKELVPGRAANTTENPNLIDLTDRKQCQKLTRADKKIIEAIGDSKNIDPYGRELSPAQGTKVLKSALKTLPKDPIIEVALKNPNLKVVFVNDNLVDAYYNDRIDVRQKFEGLRGFSGGTKENPVLYIAADATPKEIAFTLRHELHHAGLGMVHNKTEYTQKPFEEKVRNEVPFEERAVGELSPEEKAANRAYKAPTRKEAFAKALAETLKNIEKANPTANKIETYTIAAKKLGMDSYNPNELFVEAPVRIGDLISEGKWTAELEKELGPMRRFHEQTQKDAAYFLETGKHPPELTPEEVYAIVSGKKPIAPLREPATPPEPIKNAPKKPAPAPKVPIGDWIDPVVPNPDPHPAPRPVPEPVVRTPSTPLPELPLVPPELPLIPPELPLVPPELPLVLPPELPLVPARSSVFVHQNLGGTYQPTVMPAAEFGFSDHAGIQRLAGAIPVEHDYAMWKAFSEELKTNPSARTATQSVKFATTITNSAGKEFLVIGERFAVLNSNNHIAYNDVLTLVEAPPVDNTAALEEYNALKAKHMEGAAKDALGRVRKVEPLSEIHPKTVEFTKTTEAHTKPVVYDPHTHPSGEVVRQNHLVSGTKVPPPSIEPVIPSPEWMPGVDMHGRPIVAEPIVSETHTPPPPSGGTKSTPVPTAPRGSFNTGVRLGGGGTAAGMGGLEIIDGLQSGDDTKVALGAGNLTAGSMLAAGGKWTGRIGGVALIPLQIYSTEHEAAKETDPDYKNARRAVGYGSIAAGAGVGAGVSMAVGGAAAGLAAAGAVVIVPLMVVGGAAYYANAMIDVSKIYSEEDKRFNERPDNRHAISAGYSVLLNSTREEIAAHGSVAAVREAKRADFERRGAKFTGTEETGIVLDLTKPETRKVVKEELEAKIKRLEKTIRENDSYIVSARYDLFANFTQSGRDRVDRYNQARTDLEITKSAIAELGKYDANRKVMEAKREQEKKVIEAKQAKMNSALERFNDIKTPEGGIDLGKLTEERYAFDATGKHNTNPREGGITRKSLEEMDKDIAALKVLEELGNSSVKAKREALENFRKIKDNELTEIEKNPSIAPTVPSTGGPGASATTPPPKKDDGPLEQIMGFFKEHMGAGIGGIIAAIIGFVVLGPIGALLGLLVGGIAGHGIDRNHSGGDVASGHAPTNQRQLQQQLQPKVEQLAAALTNPDGKGHEAAEVIRATNSELAWLPKKTKETNEKAAMLINDLTDAQMEERLNQKLVINGKQSTMTIGQALAGSDVGLKEKAEKQFVVKAAHDYDTQMATAKKAADAEKAKGKVKEVDGGTEVDPALVTAAITSGFKQPMSGTHVS